MKGNVRVLNTGTIWYLSACCCRSQ